MFNISYILFIFAKSKLTLAMAISIELLHSDIKSQLKKHNSAFVSPAEIDIAINKAQYDTLEQVITDYEAGTSRSSADQTMLKYHSFTGTATERTLPADVFKVSTVFVSDREGDILDDKHFNDRLNSVIIPPSVERPIATVYNDGAAKIRILPSSDSHKIKYWKNPVSVVFAFTQSNGEITYNAIGSVSSEFPSSEYNRILNWTLKYLSMPAVNADAAALENNV